MKMKEIAGNAIAVLVSLILSAVLCEVGARIVLNPADYLSATMIPDPIFGITIAPNSAGFDSWGFRNASVPQSADIVAVGDSHTFGNTARMEDAWPRVVARETGQSVYNLGVGGYGPNQYYQLLATRGVALHPKRVICGLYMGDDFENAYSITYGLDHWAFLRTGNRAKVDADIWGDDEPPGRMKRVRNWLSRRSMVYRLVVHGPVLGAVKRSLQLNMATNNADPSVTTLETPDKKIREAFRPIRVAAGLDQSRPEVKEGMRITFQLLKDMDRTCREHGCEFSVVIIPTKETVFADYIQQSQQLHLKNVLESVIVNERQARAELGRFLDEAGIPYVDALPALRQAVGQNQDLYYKGPADMHPAANGYRVIGTVASTLVRDTRTTAQH